MALDRQSIERRDFPLGRRGYDPAAVDAHLSEIAAQVEAMRMSAGPTESLASSASEQVRAIVEAAEASATEIQLRAEAEARDYVARVSESRAQMLQRLTAIEAELASLIEHLRDSSAAGPLTGGVADALPDGVAEALPEDHEGARLVALNMALNGTPREETDRYLAENFELDDRQGLLDDVYASVAD